nr:UvrD-like helicase, ATP-binding domain, P-loop containing nucleoside triphosphate hydrolase [Tanacetum cinerariifolium]
AVFRSSSVWFSGFLAYLGSILGCQFVFLHMFLSSAKWFLLILVAALIMKVKEKCDICSLGCDSILCQKLNPHLLLYDLNESQKTAVMAALCKTQCCHTSSMEQIWGQPRTGKTLTASVLLFILLQMKQRTLTERLEVITDSDIEEIYLEHRNLASKELDDLFNSKPLQDDLKSESALSIDFVRAMSLSAIRTLQISLQELALPCFSNKYAITQFYFERVSIIFCTTSSSYKLHAINMEPLNILVIDEAAQSKKAESTIPLQLPGMKHAILIGDERQLPTMVNRNDCIESGFGRSLFDRLSFFGHFKHLLNVQYRMHPSISCFPNLKFYQNQILDAQNVLSESYGKGIFRDQCSAPIINVIGGKEEKDDDGRSRRNMVEVAIATKILKNLYRAWQDLPNKLTIGIISPYVSQVASIQEKLDHKYEKLDGFSVKVKLIDGFQGGEEDIIILSRVRSNIHRSLSFISSLQRTNVALTRARHCLWILRNERTLTNRAKKELEQLNDLVNGNSVLFKHAKWKVLFSDDFKRLFGKLTGSRLKKQFKVEGIYVIYTIDIIKEVKYTQVLKVWNILPLEEIPELTKRLESIFSAYTDYYINLLVRKKREKDKIRTKPDQSKKKQEA